MRESDPDKRIGNGRLEAAERETLSRRISDALDLPMAVLAFAWVGITVAELTVATDPEAAPRLYQLDALIWLAFVADFALEFAIAPDKLRYLKRNWLVAVSVAVPAFSVFRLVRAIQILRAFSLARLTFAATRFARAAADIMSQHLFGYVLLVLAAITLLGAAGVYFFDRDQPDSAFSSFWYTVYWSAAMVTTLNFGPEPATLEGRLVALGLRVSGVAFFGYVAATLASYFVGERLDPTRGRPAPLAGKIDALRAEVAALGRRIGLLERRTARANRAARSRDTSRRGDGRRRRPRR